jgi:hypothetical protein
MSDVNAKVPVPPVVDQPLKVSIFTKIGIFSSKLFTFIGKYWKPILIGVATTIGAILFLTRKPTIIDHQPVPDAKKSIADIDAQSTKNIAQIKQDGAQTITTIKNKTIDQVITGLSLDAQKSINDIKSSAVDDALSQIEKKSK